MGSRRRSSEAQREPKRPRGGHRADGAREAPRARDGAPGAAAARDAPEAAKRAASGTADPFMRAWAWKREHLPDRARFHKPYKYDLNGGGVSDAGRDVGAQLTIEQAPFGPEGFASTVWDSSIVVAKMLEKAAERVRGKRCLELSAGTGLVAVVMARLGASRVVATDLEPNLPLLRRNVAKNGADVEVAAHSWGEPVAALGGPFEVISVCDCMYVDEDDVVRALARSIAALLAADGLAVVAQGRNDRAWERFVAQCAAQGLAPPRAVGDDELDEVYRAPDVSVWEIRREAARQGD
ncbi:unnamed protein product [Pedinophyceae sp. YPF-701]|nr:unnamed protein product [Pedinophyceae sp. YPF-701]